MYVLMYVKKVTCLFVETQKSIKIETKSSKIREKKSFHFCLDFSFIL